MTSKYHVKFSIKGQIEVDLPSSADQEAIELQAKREICEHLPCEMDISDIEVHSAEEVITV